METINLEFLGPTSIQLHGSRISALTRDNGINVRFHPLPADYQSGRVKVLKRIQIRKALEKHIHHIIAKGDLANTVWCHSQPPTLLNRLLIDLTKRFSTLLDIRDIYQEWNYHGFLKQQLERWEQVSTMKAVSAITYAHEGFGPYLRKDITDRGKLHFISNGADETIFFPEKTDGLNGKLIVYCGTINPVNNISFFLRVMKRALRMEKTLRLIIVGYGRDSGIVSEWIRSGRLPRTTFIDRNVNQETLAYYYHQADYAVCSINPFASVYYHTCIPNKVFEALCTGTPIISFQGQVMTDLSRSWFNAIHNFDITRRGVDLEIISRCIVALPSVTYNEKEKIAKQAHSVFPFRLRAKRFREVLLQILERE